MPNRVQWEPGYSVGHALIDAQHQALLKQCNLLADFCQGAPDAQAEQQFDAAFEGLKALAREHFAAEASVLAACHYAELEDHITECGEFEYLAEDIVTTDHFSRLELQRFLALWWLGHIAAAKEQRACLTGGATA